MKIISHFFIIVSLLSKAWAVDIPINITGNIIIPPCEINNGNTINVDFGDIRLTELENHEHKKIISFPVNCSYHQGDAYVKITGQTMDGKDNVLATNINGLGIALYQGEEGVNYLKVGDGSSGYGYKETDALSDKNVANALFTFTAKIYKSDNISINVGEFNTTALINIIYL
ncbi:fimbrial protein [Escherichia fergusonii]|uniref:fimbrial protein n=1 Tax=Escherichia fergusonii TaxID=564 RepID=UPI001EBAB703|nr:fimbrial protein [Escherichia fergusonii]EHJ4135897.1 fimbrial protein [Escherichia fergusonii]